MEITGFLLTAHRVTGKQRYLDALAPLLAAAGPFAIGFPAAIANGQITVPEDYNFSDDELDFLAYFNLLMVSTDRFATTSLSLGCVAHTDGACLRARRRR